MKYTIKKVLPAQIEIEFEDGGKAIVPIGPDYSLEDIDDSVSYYDSDFLPDPETLINKNITAGDQRESTRKKNSRGPGFVSREEYACEEEIDPDSVPDVDLVPVQTTLYGGLPLPSFHKDQVIISYVMADYFIKKYNDDTLKKELDKKVEEYILKNDITMEKALESLMYEDDDLIVRLAEQELEDEQQ